MGGGNYFEELGTLAVEGNEIDQKAYNQYHVKAGLRNVDGSGVLVGLTRVASVIGYEKLDEEILPLPGRLYYRGIQVQDLIRGFEEENRFGFEETAYLLLFGRLPQREELDRFSTQLGEMRKVPINFVRDVLQTFRTPDIMNSLTRSLLTLYAKDDAPEDLALPNQIRQAMDLIAKIATLVPYSYYSIRQAYHDDSLILHPNDPRLSTAQNFLRLLRPSMEYTDIEAKTLDTALVLHMDHGGGNNSTFTMRVVSSTQTDFFSSAAASLGSLKGPLHGGASGKAAEMMAAVKSGVKNRNSSEEVRDYLFKILRGETFDHLGKIYGLGHAVYTVTDPRAEVLREYARRLAAEKGREEEFALFELVEKEAPDVIREYKKSPNMNVSSNVDFYSGFVYDCLNIPSGLYTPLFAVARMVGWAAHRIELLCNPNKLMRPAFKSLTKATTWIPMSERTGDMPRSETGAASGA